MKIFKTLLFISTCILFSCSGDKSPLEAGYDNSFQENYGEISLSKKSVFKVFRTPNAIVIDGVENDWTDVPKHKMRGPGGKHGHDLRRADVAAVNHLFHFQA